MNPSTVAETNAILRRLLAELDLASPGEATHAQRVAVYAVATGERMGLEDEALAELRSAALLHDIGKVRLDAATLRKLGTLSDEELAQMRRHSELAVKVIADLPSLARVVPVIRAHHERWDGSGYPDGLRGEAIPLAARIIGASEAYDVMSYGAVWMPRLGARVGREILISESGGKWCPRVIAAFREIQPIIQPAGLVE